MGKLRALLTPNLCLLGIVLGVAALIFSSTMAHAAEAHKAPPPKPPVKLYIYPKLGPPRQGEVIIKDPSRPEVDTSKWA